METRTSWELRHDHLENHTKQWVAVDDLLQKCNQNHGNVDFSITLEKELKDV